MGRRWNIGRWPAFSSGRILQPSDSFFKNPARNILMPTKTEVLFVDGAEDIYCAERKIIAG
jgi:hypothetical protein